MGWRAIYKDGSFRNEDDTNEDGSQKWGRPVEDGDKGNLLAVAQEDFGHKVAVDLTNGRIAIDYSDITVQNGDLEIHDPIFMYWICDETNIVGDLKHVDTTFPYHRDEDGKRLLHEGKFVKVRVDTFRDLEWRPIWFTRITDGVPTKCIGAQTTQPKEMGNKNAKTLVSIFIDGRIGID